MNDAHPGAVGAAIRAKRRKLEGLDPRLKLAITATENREHLNLIAVKPVEFMLGFKGDPALASEMLHDLIGRGVKVTVDAQNLEWTGSPLFAALLEEARGGRITLEVGWTVNLIVRLQAMNPEGRAVARFDVPGVANGGLTETRLHAEAPNAPFEMRITWTKGENMGPFRFLFRLSRWIGKPSANSRTLTT